MSNDKVLGILGIDENFENAITIPLENENT